MDDLQRAIKWLEFMQESGHETEAEQQHCRILLDALKENAQLKAELAEYAETFSEQNKALSDNIIANARLKAKLDAVRAECNEDRCRTWTIHRGYQTMVEAVDILAIIGKDGDTDD